MSLELDGGEGADPRHEPPAIASGDVEKACPVVRDAQFARISPTSFSLWSVPQDPAGRVEIVFQRLTPREVAHRFGGGPGQFKALIGKDVRMEVHELGSVEVSRDVLLGLRQEIDRFLGGSIRAEPNHEPAARQLLASTRSELANLQEQMTGRIDLLAEKIDGVGGALGSLRSQLGRDLEQLVRLLWPKARDAK